MASVLLIAVNRETSPYPVTPIGAMLVAAALRRAGHDATVLDLCFARRPDEAVAAAVRGTRPDVVGLSMRNLDNCVMSRPRSFLGEARSAVLAVRSATRAPVIVGGPGFSMAPEAVLAAIGADFGVVGEGEGAAVRLVEALAAGGDPLGAPGVVGRTGAGPPAELLADLAGLPGQDPAGLDLGRYLRGGGALGVQTRRGCALACVYCAYPALEGRTYRLRPAEEVAGEVERLQRQTGCRHFYFTDSAFNFPPAHAMAVSEALIRRGVRIGWEAYVNPLGLDLELARVMRRAGCVGVELGLDSASEVMLEGLGKGFDQARIARAAQALAEAGLPFAASLLFGGPGETRATALETARVLDRHVPARAVFAMTGLRVLRGAPLRRRLVEAGELAADDPLLAPRFYVSPGLGPDPAGLVEGLAATRPGWATPRLWEGRIARLCIGLLGLVGTRPVWRHARLGRALPRLLGGLGRPQDGA